MYCDVQIWNVVHCTDSERSAIERVYVYRFGKFRMWLCVQIWKVQNVVYVYRFEKLRTWCMCTDLEWCNCMRAFWYNSISWMSTWRPCTEVYRNMHNSMCKLRSWTQLFHMLLDSQKAYVYSDLQIWSGVQIQKWWITGCYLPTFNYGKNWVSSSHTSIPINRLICPR